MWVGVEGAVRVLVVRLVEVATIGAGNTTTGEVRDRNSQYMAQCSQERCISSTQLDHQHH